MFLEIPIIRGFEEYADNFAMQANFGQLLGEGLRKMFAKDCGSYVYDPMYNY
jgi:hypothetical protein